MDARQALGDLMEVSAQVEAAVLLDADGTVEAATIDDESRAEAFAAAARALVATASEIETGSPLTHLELVTAGGCVFVVRDAARAVAATTGTKPTSGLVLYDLRTCLRNAAAAEQEKPKRTRRRRDSEPAENA